MVDDGEPGNDFGKSRRWFVVYSLDLCYLFHVAFSSAASGERGNLTDLELMPL